MMAATTQKPVKKAISNFFIELRKIQPLIGGRDLIGIGLKPGAVFRQILDAVQDAKLNGIVQSRDDELLYAKKWLRRNTEQAIHKVGQIQNP
jgi:tRNA nucleotidyltransferase (CCA-adding enzyme)